MLARVEEIAGQAPVPDVFQGAPHLLRYLPGAEAAVLAPVPVKEQPEEVDRQKHDPRAGKPCGCIEENL